MKYVDKSKYEGKKFSVMGDSISSLEGYLPKGYKCYYAGEAKELSGVKEIKDTWWGRVIDFYKGELLINSSWSGSRVTRTSDQEWLFPSGCSDERTRMLHKGCIMPDVILIYFGINDWINGAKIRPDWRTAYKELETGMQERDFSYAYDEMIRKIRENYPEAELWCCTLNTSYIPNRPEYIFPYYRGGLHMESYNEVIRAVTEKYNCRLVDLYSLNKPYETMEGTHPDAIGMQTLAEMIIRLTLED